MNVTLSGETRARLDKHLDAVEAALAGAGHSREQRRGVVDDLEAQILDMLAARSQTPTVEDVEAVLAKLDPPAAYGAGQGSTVPPVRVAPPPPVLPRARYSRTALWGLACILASFGLALVVFTIGWFAMPGGHAVSARFSPPHAERVSVQPLERPAGVATLPAGVPLKDEGEGPATTATPVEQNLRAPVPSSEPRGAPPVAHTAFMGGACFLVLTGPLGFLGTVLGWVAFFQIRGSAAALTGKGLALFDGLFYPAIFAGIVFLEMLSRI